MVQSGYGGVNPLKPQSLWANREKRRVTRKGLNHNSGPQSGSFIPFVFTKFSSFYPPYYQKRVIPCDVGRLGDRSVGCLHSAYDDSSIGKV